MFENVRKLLRANPGIIYGPEQLKGPRTESNSPNCDICITFMQATDAAWYYPADLPLYKSFCLCDQCKTEFQVLLRLPLNYINIRTGTQNNA